MAQITELQANMENTIINCLLNLMQVISHTGPADTVAAINIKQCAVRCILNELATDIYKAIGRPFQVDTGMGTLIQATVNLVLSIDDE